MKHQQYSEEGKEETRPPIGLLSKTRNTSGVMGSGHSWGHQRPAGRTPEPLGTGPGRGGTGTLGFPGPGRALASQTVIVPDALCCSFPGARRVESGRHGAPGHPEIVFYELPDLAARGTQPPGMSGGQPPLPGSFCGSSGSGREVRTPPGNGGPPRGRQRGRGDSACPASVVSPDVSAAGTQRSPAIAAGGVQSRSFLQVLWERLPAPPGKRKGKRIKRKSQKISVYLV